MLYLIHNLTHVWPRPLRDIILNNCLLNPTGNPNSHVELDLVQEHLIFWIKTMYKARGSDASWEWLAHISPCIDFLRRLAREFQRTLGDDQGTKHAPTDLTRSIHTLMRSFAANEVHTVKPGRHRADTEGAPVVDIVTEGMRQLVHGADGPIAKFNRVLQWLQKRRKIMPVSTQWELLQSSLTQDQPDAEDASCKSKSPAPSINQVTAEGDQGSLEVVDMRRAGRHESQSEDESMIESETDSSGQDEHSCPETEEDQSESEESEDNEFWEEAFNIEVELGVEAFNAFGDPDMSGEDETIECNEPETGDFAVPRPAKRKAAALEKKKADAELAKQREAEKAARSYDNLFTNVEHDDDDDEDGDPKVRKTGTQLEEDFM